MKRIYLTALAFVLALIAPLLSFTGVAQATQNDPNSDHKVTICHRTGSDDGGELKNGYNEITVDVAASGLLQGGHEGHEQVGNGPGPDIIPAYQAFAKVHGEWVDFSYEGKDLDFEFPDGTTGAEFLANHCRFNIPTQPNPKVVVTTEEVPDCVLGLRSRATTVTTPYVLVDREWVLDTENSASVVGEWVFVRDLTDAEKYELGCDYTPPKPEVEVTVFTVPSTDCVLGYRTRVHTVTKDWLKETGIWVSFVSENVSVWTWVRDLTPLERAEAGCPLPKPEPIVVVTTDEDKDCESGVISRSTTTTVDHVLVSSGVWIPDAEHATVVVGEWIVVRPLNAEEKVAENCPTATPPPPPAPPVVTPVVQPVSQPQPVVQSQPVAQPVAQPQVAAAPLPKTGADALGLFARGLLALIAGAVTALVANRRNRA